MKRPTRLLLIILILSTLCVILPVAAAPVIINHTSTHLSEIPKYAITTAKSNLHIAYGHTSHGSQIITGMDKLRTFPNAPYGNTTYSFNNGGSGGALDLRDSPFSGAYDLGNPDRTAWANATRDYLEANPEINVIIWSWCGEADTSDAGDITTYLNLMNGLEAEYPEVKFVYMTGHLVGTGKAGDLNKRNEQIRNYVRAHNKILYDFADIESYDPDGLTNYMLLNANDNCDYDSGNWAIKWQDAHVEGHDWYFCEPAHTQPLNGNLKAYAAWWLWARLGGWDGVPVLSITSITPDSGPTKGNTTISIRGTNFVSGGSFGVKIGGAAAISVVRVNATTITAKTPAGSAGARNVVVTNKDGQTGTKAGVFTYL
jgi:hypothetical protein